MDIHYRPSQYIIHHQLASYSSLNFFNLAIVLLAVNAVGVFSSHAPPAIYFLQAMHFHTPITVLLTVCFPQNGQMYLALYDTSNFFAIFLRDEPYLVPYFLVIPTF